MAIPEVHDSSVPAVAPSIMPCRKRRRTPVTGAACDCFTCIGQNIRCDRKRPYCSPCLERGKDCAGYKTTLTWGFGVASRGKLRGMSLPIAGSQQMPLPPLGKASHKRGSINGELPLSRRRLQKPETISGLPEPIPKAPTLADNHSSVSEDAIMKWQVVPLDEHIPVPTRLNFAHCRASPGHMLEESPRSTKSKQTGFPTSQRPLERYQDQGAGAVTPTETEGYASAIRSPRKIWSHRLNATNFVRGSDAESWSGQTSLQGGPNPGKFDESLANKMSQSLRKKCQEPLSHTQFGADSPQSRPRSEGIEGTKESLSYAGSGVERSDMASAAISLNHNALPWSPFSDISSNAVSHQVLC